MIYSGLFGLTFTPDQVSISPTLPPAWGDVGLYGLPYRDATLDITLTGAGNRVRSCTVDGRSSRPVIPATVTGHHTVHVVLEN
jgi:cellobiose phosphorylase